MSRVDKLPGGRGDKLDATEVDPAELRRGEKVEREHTTDPELAREIALDHLAESPTYYTDLLQVEPEVNQKPPDNRTFVEGDDLVELIGDVAVALLERGEAPIGVEILTWIRDVSAGRR
jgi:hypothetical protein